MDNPPTVVMINVSRTAAPFIRAASESYVLVVIAHSREILYPFCRARGSSYDGDQTTRHDPSSVIQGPVFLLRCNSNDQGANSSTFFQLTRHN